MSMALGAEASAQAPAPADPAKQVAPSEARPSKVHLALKTAIDSYRRGEYELAAGFFKQAQAGQADLSEAERQDLKTWIDLNNAAVNARRDAVQKLQQAEEAVRAGRTQEALTLVKAATGTQQFLTAADKQRLQRLTEQLRPADPKAAPTNSTAILAKARAQLQQARGLIAKGNYDAALALAQEADKLGATYTANEDTPKKVMEDINRARAVVIESQDGKGYLKAARQAYDRGDWDTAEALAREAEKLGGAWSRFTLWADTPAKVLKDVQTARARKAGSSSVKAPAAAQPVPTSSVAKGAAASTPSDPKTLVKNGRELLAAGKLDEAEKVCNQAAATKTTWGVFEDSPERLMQDIRAAKAKRDVEESVKVLAQARSMFEKANGDLKVLDEAEKLTYKAERLHGPYSVFDLGDRPHKLRAEIDAARTAARKNPKPAPAKTEVAKTEVARTEPQGPVLPALPMPAQSSIQQVDSRVPTPPAPTPPPALEPPPLPTPSTSGPAASSKAEAQKLIAEARQLQQEGRLLEAREKAMAAQKLAASFGPEDDRPELVLLALTALCEKRVETLLQQASDHMAAAATDPSRLHKAEADLTQARQLAVGFAIDTHRIDAKLAALKTAGTATAQVPAPVLPALPALDPPPAASAPSSNTARGQALLDQARTELRKGETTTARRLAEEAFSGNYGVQSEAEKLLRSIDAEEYNQRFLAASRAFDAGLQALQRKDHVQAALILRGIDKQLLPPEKQQKLKELMLLPELQPSAVTQTGMKAATAGLAQAADQPAAKPADDQAEQLKAMQDVRYQALQLENIKVLQEAQERFRVGETDRALELLNDQLSALREAQLDPQRIAKLRRPVESQLERFRALKAQRDVEKLQASQVESFYKSKQRELLAEESKKKQLAELNRQYRAFMKEGKYKEAEMLAYRAKELDPEDPTVGVMIHYARTQLNQAEANKIKRRKEDMFVAGLDDAEDVGPVVTSNKPVSIDKQVMQTAMKRKGTDLINLERKSEKERQIELRLQAPISLNFTDTPLRQVLDDLRDWTGINIVPDEPALQEEGIRLDRPVTMKLENVSLKSALNLLLHQVHLTYVVADEVLKVTTESHARGKLVSKIYNVVDLVVPVQDSTADGANILRTALQQGENPNLRLNGVAPWLGTNSLHTGTPVGGNAGGSTNAANMTSQQGVKKEGPKGTLEDLLIRLITNTVAPQSWSSMGGPGTIEYYPLGMALVITQTPDIQEQIADLLAALRRLQDQQVSVEVRFISIAESFFERIGLDFNVNLKTDRYTTKYEPQIVSQQFKPFGYVNDFNPKNTVIGLTPGGTFTQDLDIPIRTSSFNQAIPPFGAFPNIPGGNGGIDIGLAFLSDIQVFLFMEAAQGDQRTNVMQAPKLTLFNGQTATLTVSDQQFFVTNVTVVQAGGQVVFVPQNIPIPTGGITLTIQAVISADRRYTRLNIVPQITNLTTAIIPLFPITTFITPVFEGGAVGQPIPFTQFLQQPVFNIINVQTTVAVPDGGTVLLGGLKRLSEGRNEFGPPVLSKVPYINRLFKNVGYGREAESLLLMVTPRIIINEEEEYTQTGVSSGGFGADNEPRP